MNIVVVGVGYVGIVSAVCFSNRGHSVTCVELDSAKVERLRQGNPLIFEPDLAELMLQNRQRLTFTTDGTAAYQQADAIFICVGTPERHDGSADLRYVKAVSKEIAKAVTKETVVIIKSTVPIGTCTKMEDKMNDWAEHPIHVVSNPEFLSQGTAVRDTLHTQRVVIGTDSHYAKEVMLQVYAGETAPLVITNRESSEMIKYASNDFLALKISYINEIANLCEKVGADVSAVSRGMGLDHRIGQQFLNAGIGYGGSCFPKDTKALHWVAKYHDYEISTVKAAIEVNENQKIKLYKKARKLCKPLKGKTVAILGLTFKPNTDDLREAPSLENIPLFLDDDAEVRVWDPVGMENFKKHYPTEVTYCNTIDQAIKGADVCCIFTEWDAVKDYPLERFSQLMHQPLVLDGRNCYGLDAARDAGLQYYSIGRAFVHGVEGG